MNRRQRQQRPHAAGLASGRRNSRRTGRDPAGPTRQLSSSPASLGQQARRPAPRRRARRDARRLGARRHRVVGAELAAQQAAQPPDVRRDLFRRLELHDLPRAASRADRHRVRAVQKLGAADARQLAAKQFDRDRRANDRSARRRRAATPRPARRDRPAGRASCAARSRCPRARQTPPGFSTASARRRRGTGPAARPSRAPAGRSRNSASGCPTTSGDGRNRARVGRLPGRRRGAHDLPRRDLPDQPVLDLGHQKIRVAAIRQPHDRAGHDVGIAAASPRSSTRSRSLQTRRIQSPSSARPWPASSDAGKADRLLPAARRAEARMPHRNRLVFGQRIAKTQHRLHRQLMIGRAHRLDHGVARRPTPSR